MSKRGAPQALRPTKPGARWWLATGSTQWKGRKRVRGPSCGGIAADGVPAPEHLLPVSAVAGRIGVGVATVHQAINAGELRWVLFGSVRRVRPEDLEEYVQSRSASRPPADEDWCTALTIAQRLALLALPASHPETWADLDELPPEPSKRHRRHGLPLRAHGYVSRPPGALRHPP
jgi:excisionase family DNA binding protein